MCVICVCMANKPRPAKRLLKAMYKANPDGIGLQSNSVSFKTFDFEDFYHVFTSIPKSENIVVHFRFATHGSVSRHNIHPFYSGGIAFFHNGVLPIASKNDMTDSEICFREKIMPKIREVGIDGASDFINSVRGSSRFAIMHRGIVRTYGSFEPYGGVLYSNLRWLPYVEEKRVNSDSYNYSRWLSCHAV